MPYPLYDVRVFQSKGIIYEVFAIVVKDEPATYVFKVRGYDSQGNLVRLGNTTKVRSAFIRAFVESDRTVQKGFDAVEDWVRANW